MKTCGSCSACCVLTYIEELNKPVHEPCVHLKKCGGCGIYEVRPQVCRKFQCAWSLGIGPGKWEDRPDKSGVLLYLTDKAESTEGKLAFIALEAYEGAAQLNEHYRSYIEKQRTVDKRVTLVCFKDKAKPVVPEGVEVVIG